ncbi:hypothetical protein [Pseudonocardia sp. T1-2H]|uniref:hypothetical protein n=1 Tax=Pseudonocardia sp. T1-2H TaxID=3128899 RepID=UPI0031013668
MSRPRRPRPADRKMLVRSILTGACVPIRGDSVTVLAAHRVLVRWADQADVLRVLRRYGLDARPVSDHVLVTWPA